MYRFIEGFENSYSYVVTFTDAGNHAGNHFHRKKHELFIPLVGNMRAILAKVDGTEREEINMSADRHQVVYVPPPVAHTVVAESNPAVLMVVANHPNVHGDEFPCQLIESKARPEP